MLSFIKRLFKQIINREDIICHYPPSDFDMPEQPNTYKESPKLLSLNHLPFEPQKDEVIFVENGYDEKFNRFIIDNLDTIVKCFAKRDLTFIYLPFLNKNIEKQEKVIRYWMPHYDKGSNSNLTRLENSFLLDYMSHPEERDNIKPCFAIHYCVYINGISIYKSAKSDITYSLYELDIDNITSPGDFFYNMADFIADSTKSYFLERNNYPAINRKQEYSDDATKKILYNADDNFDEETQCLLDEVKTKIDFLRSKGISQIILEQLVEQNVKLSRIVISKDYRIVLPDYNNIEIIMTPLVKAVYLLFLRHPEGILFKELVDYRQELSYIYHDIKGIKTSNQQTVVQTYNDSIINVTDPLKNSINEKCTRIKEAFLIRFQETLAKEYFITGKKGEPKRITLPKDLIIWE